MSANRDSAQKRASAPLTDFERPSVAVDTAVLTVADGALCVVLVPNAEGWRLPGTFVHAGETLALAVLRSLRQKAGIEGVHPRQLHVFDAPHRDDRGWVMSVAHLVTVPAASVADTVLAGSTVLTPWHDAHDAHDLVCDHAQILRMAVETLRQSYRTHADPDRLLGTEFTLYELLRLHETIAGERLGKDTFRRHMRDQLVETDSHRPGVVGKPATLFRHGSS
ncbi:NUDIX domain-containing protein [Cryobacterium frigoriphilum]|uniref:NUDIX domain-containing protein n=1 Tax=Cryobacterium frigoriphilum TaxID=1259150 RepID=A0A4R9A701_9MICO|nr:NUDIX domain-containing protein [Cryobacterium frigoriphilum]TFD52743.1 NUDIX domain-containing protein [Cryobacterium frigoriphilum]